MALWQYEFNIVPQGQSSSNYSQDKTLSWREIKLSPSIHVFFSEMLPLSDSWSSDIKVYGKNDSTCVEFLFENGCIEEISCRLDLRNLSKTMLINILKFIKSISGEILADSRIIKPELSDIVPIMKSSNAAKFCSNPDEYLKQLGTELQ